MPEVTNAELEGVTSTVSAEVEEPDEDPRNDLRRKNGDASVYKYYLSSAGYPIAIGFFLTTMTWVFFTEFPSKSS
jgi:hypothetical protein